MYIVQKFCRKVELMCVLMSSRAINYTGGAIKSITGAYDAKYSSIQKIGDKEFAVSLMILVNILNSVEKWN